MQSQRIAVLGATGSIGASALDICRRHPDTLRVALLSAGTRVQELADLCVEFRPRFAHIADPNLQSALQQALDHHGLSSTVAVAGDADLCSLVASDHCDTVIAAIVGAAGLNSTLAAARAGKRLLLANKESLVVAGELLMQAARQGGATIVPIDSEHNAVFQCLASCNAPDQVAKVTLTASGGPFRGRTKADLATITPEQAVKHPKWSMGRKISVDSATLMNKGLEVIEAHHLFALPPAQIDVLVHPQSLVHSLVEFVDGSSMAQLGLPDMRTALAVGFAWPSRVASGVGGLDLLAQGGQLTFKPPDLDTFTCLAHAFAALRAGGTAPTILNAANEVAVDAFLNGRLSFPGIAAVVGDTLEALDSTPAEQIEHLLETDRQARLIATRRVELTAA